VTLSVTGLSPAGEWFRPAVPAWLHAVPGGPDGVRRVARDILARPEFRPPPQSPIDRVRQWLAQKLTELITNLLRGSGLTWIGLLAVVAVTSGLVYLAVRAARGTTGNPVHRGYAVLGATRSTADWLAEAAACEGRGDWRGALRCRYRALVADLAARGLVEEIPGRTTGEYRAAVQRNLPRAAEDFGAATDLFEVAWYTDAETTVEESHELAAVAKRVVGAAR
jgi:hypothetical protein